MAEEYEPGNKDATERFSTLEHEQGRLPSVKKTPQRFERLATGAIEGPGTKEDVTESSEKEQWQKTTKEELRSVEDIINRARAA